MLKAGSTLPVTKTVQITNSGSGSVTLAIAVATGTAASGATVTTDKTSVTVAAGATGSFNVSWAARFPRAGRTPARSRCKPPASRCVCRICSW